MSEKGNFVLLKARLIKDIENVFSFHLSWRITAEAICNISLCK
jgi:hypothetical protein